jgi:hypothetical protein
MRPTANLLFRHFTPSPNLFIYNLMFYVAATRDSSSSSSSSSSSFSPHQATTLYKSTMEEGRRGF